MFFIKILGIDFGEARMGLASSDISETIAGGLGTYKVTGLKNAVKVAAEVAEENNAELIVIGLPINMDGTQGNRAEKTRVFGDLLKEQTGIDIVYIDERRTTILASGYMNETGTSGKKRKDKIDTLAAQIILQSYLDLKKNTEQKNN